MEGDHASSAEPPERAISGTGARSYDCIFCKRGFSNAQALGGHMNIHRKDKAKLKQPPPYDDDRTISSSSSVTIKDSVVSSYSLSTRNFSTSRLGHGNHVGASTLPFKWPWIVAPREQDIQEEVGRGGGEDDETCTQHSNNRREGGEPEAMELDLELRLGPEPPRASMTSLKEFL